MKIVCISDTHSFHRRMHHSIPDGDVLIHAGDITRKGDLNDVIDFNDWISELPHKHKIVIAGNHDFCFENYPKEAQAALTACSYLQDSAVEIDGVKFYGSPWQPWFFDWAFNLKRGVQLKNVWDKIPLATDVLITHGPPFGILDRVNSGELVGCEDLSARIDLIKPKLHVFGHIHEAYGNLSRRGTRFINASICNLQYQAMNAPIVVKI